MMEFKQRPREQRLREIFIGQTLVALLILGISAYLVFLGLGYKINWETRKIQHMGILYLSYIPKDATIKISGQDYNNSSPFSTTLVPGTYQAEVLKGGFTSWTHETKVAADRVTSFKNISLFRKEPKVEDVTDQETINSINAPYDSLIKNPRGDLDFTDYEIWYSDQLVTRLSSKINGVIWYPGSEYIAYQNADTIRVIQKDGTNDTTLIKLSSADPTNFLFSWDGSYILYKDGLAYKKAQVN